MLYHNNQEKSAYLSRNPSADKVRAAITHDLRQHIDLAYRKGAMKYIKEGIVLYGVRLHKVRKISAKYYREISRSGKAYVLALCDRLVRSRYAEEKTIAFDWAYRLRNNYTPEDFRRFESWLKEHVSNWGNCDDLCRHALGAHVYRFPVFLPRVTTWTGSRNRWLRRGAAVTMIYSLREGEHLDAAIRIAEALMGDDDYLVQNGYGWMLKDASILYADKILEFVMLNRERFPRRALRYAIERYSPQEKKAVMA